MLAVVLWVVEEVAGLYLLFHVAVIVCVFFKESIVADERWSPNVSGFQILEYNIFVNFLLSAVD